MNPLETTELSVHLPLETMNYLEQYRVAHGLSSLEVVLNKAVRALREQELVQSYREWAEYERTHPDPLIDAGISDGLEPSDGKEWL